MATKITDTDGNVLWNPNDFGDYSIDKIEAITKIIVSALKNTSLTMITSLDDMSKQTVYTREESDAMFVKLATYLQSVQDEVHKSIASEVTSGNVLNESSLVSINKYINALYLSCFGMNAGETNRTQDCYDTKIDSMQKNVTSNYSLISGVIRDIYEANQDGSLSANLKVATKSSVGEITDLNTYLINRENIVEAINCLVQIVKSMDTDTITSNISGLSTNIANLQTDVKQVQTSTNNINTNISNANNSISLLQNKTDTLNNGVNANKEDIANLKTDLLANTKDIEAIVDTIGDIGIVSLETTDKTLLGGMNEIAVAIKSIQTELANIETRLEALENA